MIANARKIPILRYCLIILLFIALIIGAGYLYLHYKKAQLLRGNIENVIAARENSALIDSCIIKLYSADNNSRLYTLTDNKTYLNDFVGDINNVLAIFNKLKFNEKDIQDANPVKFKDLLKEKTTKTSIYIKLRLLTDSLIKSAVKFNDSINLIPADEPAQVDKPVFKVIHRVKIDTIKAKESPRKKLLGRIFAAFSKKKEEKPKLLIIKKDTVIYSIVMPNTAVNKTVTVKNDNWVNKNTGIYNNAYKSYYKKLNTVNNKLRSNELQVLMLNNNLAQQIITSLKTYKSVEQSYIEKSKIDLQENLADVFSEFKKVSAINFISLIALLILVFYNIWKIFRNEQKLIKYSKSTEDYALLKSRFLTGMSHEIRTPLNSVIGFSEQLSQEDLPQSQKEQVTAIRNSSEMILDLVNEILDFSKYETGKMNFENSPFMLKQVFEEIFTTMHIHALKKHIALENDMIIDEDLCCEGDKMRLKQVLMNLLGNAIKFTIEGKVSLHATVENKPARNVLLKVKVTDTGLGIDKEDMPYIFDEFSQIDKAQKVTRHKGTGLGLAICKKIIELQGGSINVSSTIGQGSVFSFELPLKQLDNKECVIPQSISDELMTHLVKDKYILLAEDNKLNVLLTVTILKKWGIKYDVAYNGEEALRLFEANNYDLVLTDIQMPVMDGLQLTQQIRGYTDPLKANIIIMALTANVLKEDRDLYLNTGMNDVVLKPFLEKGLIEKISLAIQNNNSALRLIN